MRVTIVLLLAAWVVTAIAAGQERPGPDGAWRVHQLSRCHRPPPPSVGARAYLAEGLELFDLENGGDAIVVLEDGLTREPLSPWIRLLLAQIYILAGQGEPHCQPSGGPMAPTGDWDTDRVCWLERADQLLGGLAGTWPDDGIVRFLRADAARALGDVERAAEFDYAGRQLCTRVATLDFVADLRGLGRKTADLTTPIVPDYPEECARKNVAGVVSLDLLVDPQGRVAESVPLNRVDRRLVSAAREAAADAGFHAAMVGYYPVWSWIRIEISFTLEN